MCESQQSLTLTLLLQSLFISLTSAQSNGPWFSNFTKIATRTKYSIFAWMETEPPGYVVLGFGHLYWNASISFILWISFATKWCFRDNSDTRIHSFEMSSQTFKDSSQIPFKSNKTGFYQISYISMLCRFSFLSGIKRLLQVFKNLLFT